VDRARSREPGAASGECDQDARNATQGQTAARGQFALFGKGRALERMVSDARSCEQGARSERRDSAALSVMGFQLLRGAGDMPASTDFKSNLELRRLAQAPLQTYSNCPEVGGPGFVAAAIYGATRRIILLLEWSKNLPIDQRRSGTPMEW